MIIISLIIIKAQSRLSKKVMKTKEELKYFNKMKERSYKLQHIITTSENKNKVFRATKELNKIVKYENIRKQKIEEIESDIAHKYGVVYCCPECNEYTMSISYEAIGSNMITGDDVTIDYYHCHFCGCSN